MDAVEAFKKKDEAAIHICNGHRYLGRFIGDTDREREWVKEKLAIYVSVVEAMSEILKHVPHAAYTGMQCSLQQE